MNAGRLFVVDMWQDFCSGLTILRTRSLWLALLSGTRTWLCRKGGFFFDYYWLPCRWTTDWKGGFFFDYYWLPCRWTTDWCNYATHQFDSACMMIYLSSCKNTNYFRCL